MLKEKFINLDQTIEQLFEDSKYDHLRMMKGMAKTIFRPLTPADFKDVYLSISKDQGMALYHLIKE